MLAFGAALATRSGTTLPSSAGSQRSPLSAPGAGHPALGHADVVALHVEDAAGDARRLGAAEPDHDRRDVRRVEGVELLGLLLGRRRAHAEVLGHAGEGGRGDGVHGDAVALQLHGGDDGERGDPRLGGPVVGLAHVAVDARGRRGVDDAGVVRLAGLGAVAPVLHGVAGRGEGAAQVDLDHGVPLVDRHVDQHAVAQDARVVDEHVDRPVGVDGRLDQAARALVVRDVVAVGHGLAAHAADLVDHLAGRTVRGAGPVHLRAQVVDDELGALVGELERVLPPDASACPGDDDDPSVTDTHVQLLWSLSVGLEAVRSCFAL